MADADRALAETLARFGLASLTSQPSLCRNTLRDKLPDNPRETALLVSALEAGVPSRLSTESHISDVETVTAQLAGGLERSHGLSAESARWAVETWAAALNLSSTAGAPGGASTPGRAPEGATILRTPSDEATALPPSSGEATVVPNPPGGAAAARVPSGEATALRATPPTETPPTPPTPTPPGPDAAGGKRGRRLLLIAGVVVLVGAVAGIVVALSGGSKGGGHRAGGSGSASHSNAAPPNGSGSSSGSTSATPAPTFVAIPPELAHRGDHDGFPQETIPAFVQAAQRGFATETDVRWSKDGVALITHDDSTGRGMRCSGGPYVVADTTWAVLHSHCQTPRSAAKTGKPYGIPTFDETVHQLSKISGATLLAEIKVDQTTAQNEQFLAILQKWNMVSRTVVTSFVSSYLENFYKVGQQAGVAVRTLRWANTAQPTTIADLKHIHAWGVDFQLEPGANVATEVRAAQQNGLHVGISSTSPPAPADGPEQWAEAKSLHAEFVLTDHPSAYAAWLAQQ